MEQWLTEIRPHRFEADVLKCPKPALVVFLKRGIASGDILVAVLRRLAREAEPEICFFKADVEGCADLAARYRIEKTPTTLLFVKGRITAHFIGMMSARKIREIVGTGLG
ncbi:MAG: thioredoxin family protein [Phaeodactylibacter sp.]|nr:thioredoxin family protein [Phaeodactylibacter sp.]